MIGKINTKCSLVNFRLRFLDSWGFRLENQWKKSNKKGVMKAWGWKKKGLKQKRWKIQGLWKRKLRILKALRFKGR